MITQRVNTVYQDDGRGVASFMIYVELMLNDFDCLTNFSGNVIGRFDCFKLMLQQILIEDQFLNIFGVIL